MDKDEIISAFAFKTGKLIEGLIKEQTDNLQERNQMLEAKILQWYAKSRDEGFAEHFGITTMRSGNAL
jgi:hypothetical protein